MDKEKTTIHPFHIRTSGESADILVRNGQTGMTIFQRDGASVYPDNDFRNPIRLTHTDLARLRLLAKGKSNEEIATDHSRNINTVKNHFTGLFDKLMVTNRTGAIIESVNLGIIGQEEIGTRS